MSYIVIPKGYPSEPLYDAYHQGLEDGKRSFSPWKRIARRLRSKYRTELALEKARHGATKQALIMMIETLAESIGTVNDQDWEDAPTGEKPS